MNILEQIIVHKRSELTERLAQMPLSSFEAELTQSDRNFKQALIRDKQNHGAAFILECKKASPSKGLIRAQFDLDEICEAYGKHATCVSVLTDEKYFQGAFERILEVRKKLSQPVLCKDFIISEYQISLARYFGANAVLLMLSVLDDDEYKILNAKADEYGMHVLCEVSNQEEMARAVNLSADIIGINNRNLRDLTTDLSQTPNLVERFKTLADNSQQANTLLISESGIYHHGQVKHLSPYVHGFLVGSSLMAETDLDAACKQLIQGEHKVCGLTSQEDAIKAARLGASFAGLIFVESSPRAIDTSAAKALIDECRKQTSLKFVAVVQNSSVAEMLTLVETLDIDAIQLHGEESQDDIDQLKHALATQNKQVQVWKVVGISPEGDLPSQWPVADRILLDTKTKAASGGTGISFDWTQLETLDINVPVMLAGGLKPGNIAQAAALPVVGLDINSGVESCPGVKDHQLMAQVFQHLMPQTNLNIKR